MLHASAYRALRAPTLNELIRGFRVGNVQTLANPALEPEALTGGEASWHLQRGTGSLRAVAFYTSLDEAIVNVTVSTPPALITRERRNAGRIRSPGVELESTWRPARWMTARGTVALTDATFVEAVDPGLQGKRVRQVPRWQGPVGIDSTAHVGRSPLRTVGTPRLARVG